MAKREEESIGEPDEPKLERLEFWMVKISPFGRNDMAAGRNDMAALIMTQERERLPSYVLSVAGCALRACELKAEGSKVKTQSKRKCKEPLRRSCFQL
jgi:hypothetical protein